VRSSEFDFVFLTRQIDGQLAKRKETEFISVRPDKFLSLLINW
jgi:hypothetical protein